MSNTETEKKTKAPVAKKAWIDSTGNEVEDIEAATGLSYTSLAKGTTYLYQMPDAKVGSVQTMLALFGATTLATNHASWNRGAARPEDFREDDTVAVRERFERLVDGDWGTKGGGGPQIDVEVLFKAVTEVTGTAPAIDGDSEKWKTKVTEDSALRSTLRKHSKIAPVYDRLAREASGREEKDLDELLKI